MLGDCWMRGKVSPCAGTDEAVADKGVELERDIEARASLNVVDDEGIVTFEEVRVENAVVVTPKETVTVSSNPVSSLLADWLLCVNSRRDGVVVGTNVNDLVTATESNASGFKGSFGTAGTTAATVPVLAAEGTVEFKTESELTLEGCTVVVVKVEDVGVVNPVTVSDTFAEATAFAGTAKLTFSSGTFPVARATVLGNAVNTLVETALSAPPVIPLLVVSNVEKPMDCEGGKNLGPSVTVLDTPWIGVTVVVPRSKEVVVAVKVNDFKIAEESKALGWSGSLGTAGTIATTVLLLVEVVEDREDEVYGKGLVVGIGVEVAGGVNVDRLVVEDEDDE